MLSLILPTYNEAQNLPGLVDLLDGVLRDIPHEIIIVDDNSPDGTWRVAQMLSQDFSSVRVLRRIGKKGLSSAVVDGFDSAGGDIVAVMDADGQHDSALLLAMVRILESHSADIVIGSRYVVGGSVGDWVRDRRIISKIGTFLCNRLSTTPVSDPLGGFFMMRHALYKDIRSSLRPTGFKILLEILANLPESARLHELPLIFRPRLHGESKLSLRVHIDFVLQVLRLALHHFTSRMRIFVHVAFWIMSVMILLVLLSRFWSIRLLYTNAEVRAHVTQALIDISAREGWILSDVEILSIGTMSMTILHKEHMRHAPAPSICTIDYTPLTLTCDKSTS